MKQLIRFVLRHVPRRYIQRVVHLCTPLVGLFYAGSRVQCPVCGNRYRKFMPYGYVNSRENALCPHCLALERHRLMWLYLQNETDFFEAPARVLHIAPEYCFLKRFGRLPQLDYVTADLESPLAKVKMDVQRIPFPDGEFDVIFCNHILEHVDDDRQAMRELFRVMRPGGWGIMLSPVNPDRETTYEDPSITDPVQRELHFGQKDHLRDYGRDYGERLAEAGFDVEEIDYIRFLSPEAAALYGLRSEMIYRSEGIRLVREKRTPLCRNVRIRPGGVFVSGGVLRQSIGSASNFWMSMPTDSFSICGSNVVKCLVASCSASTSAFCQTSMIANRIGSVGCK